MADLDIPNPEITEYEGSQTVHEVYDFGHEDLGDISDFIRENHPSIDPEGYFVRVSYIDAYGHEQWIQSKTWSMDDYDEFMDDIADDLDAYGADGYGSVSVGYIGVS